MTRRPPRGVSGGADGISGAGRMYIPGVCSCGSVRPGTFLLCTAAPDGSHLQLRGWVGLRPVVRIGEARKSSPWEMIMNLHINDGKEK